MEQFDFQGSKKRKHYFEGWYYKNVQEDMFYSLAVIPGICLNGEDSHAFIQLNDSTKSYYFRYPLDQFALANDCIWIGTSYFGKEQLFLDIDKEISIHGKLEFTDLTPLKKTWYRPTIMGPFSYFKMQCNHGIISLKHSISGTLTVDGKEVCFDRGLGYIEKDYGTSFPKDYIWCSANCSVNHDSSFFFSVAHIPFLGLSFKGFICILFVDGKEYSFCTYNRAKIKEIFVKDGLLKIRLKKGDLVLEVQCYYDQDHLLLAPEKGQMIVPIKESLDATMKVKLFENNKLIYSDLFLAGGLEIKKEPEGSKK